MVSKYIKQKKFRANRRTDEATIVVGISVASAQEPTEQVG
jgi:hypothetical protein